MNEMVIEKKTDSSSRLGLSLATLIFILMGFYSATSKEAFAITMFGVSLLSIFYIVYYLIYTDQHIDIFKETIKNIIIFMILAVIPIVGPIILLFWAFYNILQSIDAIKKLIPDALFCIAIYILLWIPHIDEFRYYTIPAYIFYGVISLSFIKKISNLPLDSRASFFKFSIMLISLPLIGLLVASISAALRSMFQTITETKTSIIKTPQQVSGYIKEGKVINGYTRMVGKSVSQTVLKTVLGTGAITAATGKTIAVALTQDQKSGSFTSAEPQLTEQMTAFIEREFVTSKEHSFYAYDQIDQKKINRFINKFNNKTHQFSIKREDVLFYFDDTLMGFGDVGALITKRYLVYQKIFFKEFFIIELSDISQIRMSGTINKKIQITIKSGDRKEIELTQSNKGAMLFCEALQYLVKNECMLQAGVVDEIMPPSQSGI